MYRQIRAISMDRSSPTVRPKNGRIDGGGAPLRQIGSGDEKDTADSGQLLQKLREGRNGSFLFSIEIAVDAGMQRGKRNREGQNPQHGYGTGFF